MIDIINIVNIITRIHTDYINYVINVYVKIYLIIKKIN